MIREYEDADLEDVLLLCERVQDHTGGNYPPESIIEEYYGVGRKGLTEWLAKGDGQRFVYLREDEIIGHIEISNPGDDPYWEQAFPGVDLNSISIIKRLLVSPRYQKRDYGKELIYFAIEKIESVNRIPAGVALDALTDAQR